MPDDPKPIKLHRKVTWTVSDDAGATVSISVTGLSGDDAGGPPNMAEHWANLAKMLNDIMRKEPTTWEWADPNDREPWDD